MSTYLLHKATIVTSEKEAVGSIIISEGKIAEVIYMDDEGFDYKVFSAVKKYSDIQRIELEGKSCNNANAWMPSATEAGSKNLTYALENGAKYSVGQTRLEAAVGFDSYKFDELPGSRMTEESTEGMTVQVFEGGDINNFSSVVRIVVPFAAGLPEVRDAVLSYIKIG